MKFLFIISFTIINYFTVLGQLKTNIIPEKNNINLFEYSINDTINKSSNIKKNLFCVDINYIGISVAYAHRIKESKWFIGGGGGIGLEEAFFNPIDPFYYYTDSYIGITNIYLDKIEFFPCNDIIHLECFGIFLSSKYLTLETGVRASVKMILEMEEGLDMFLGGYFKPMVGLRNFKIGALIEITPYVSIYFTPLFRYNFTF